MIVVLATNVVLAGLSVVLLFVPGAPPLPVSVLSALTDIVSGAFALNEVLPISEMVRALGFYLQAWMLGLLLRIPAKAWATILGGG